MSLNREGKTYRHRLNNALVLVVKSKRLSAGTAIHTVLIIEAGDGTTTDGKPIRAGEQKDVDENPVNKWERIWEEV
jgi:hypothetical protein